MARRAVPLLLSALILAVGMTYLALRATSAFDCAVVTSWEANGVVVDVVSDCQPDAAGLRNGDLVTGIDGHRLTEPNGARQWAAGDTLEYTVVRAESELTVPVTLVQTDLIGALAPLRSTVVFITTFLAVAAFLAWRRPSAATAALLIAASGWFIATPAWWLGLPSVTVLDDHVRWLYAASVLGFSVGWSGALTFFLLFPQPFRRIARLPPPVRWALYSSPFWLIGGSDLVMMARGGTPLGTIGTAAGTGDLVQIVGSLAFIAIAWARLRQPKDAVVRQQVRWLAGGLLLGVVAYLAGWLLPELLIGDSLPPELSGLPGFVFLIGLAVAVLRYRLFDLEVVLNRGLVYGLLTATVVTVYFGIIAATAGVLGRDAVTPAAIVATAAVAVAVNPLRLLLQRTVDRLMYGDRDDPYSALSRLERRLDATGDQDRILSSVAEDVTDALRVPYAEIDVGERHVEAGTRPRWLTGENGLFDIPLTDGAERIGRMSIAPRAPGAAFSKADQQLAHDLARRVSAAARELSLRADLQRSREQLILAREEERRALRRALHDEFGPVVAGLGLQTEAARKIIKTDSGAASATLSKVRTDADHLVTDIRRLAYDLRPPALDELGLAGALRRYARTVDNLDVTVTVSPDPLGDLPAAVEAAAYRIAAEAITNARRHADAEHCGVTLTRDNTTLTVDVADDGRGLPPDFTAGVGVSAMRERAAELGGSCRIERSTTGGTVVRATLPAPSGGGDRDGHHQS